MNTERFLTSFSWNEAKFPARRPLRETVDKLSESVARLEDELKVSLWPMPVALQALHPCPGHVPLHCSIYTRISMHRLGARWILRPLPVTCFPCCLHPAQLKLAEYNVVKGQLGAINRKQGGTLAVRDLSDVVQNARVCAMRPLD